MRRQEALLSMVAAVLMIAAGITWLFGAYGLIGSGVAIALFLSFINIREG